MRFALAACLVLALPSATLAQVDDNLAARYVEASGLEDQVEQVAEQLRPQLEMQVPQLPEPAQGTYRTLIEEELSEETLGARLRAYVAQAGEADSVGAAVEWLGQPLIRQMQALSDSIAGDDNAQVAVQMYAMSGRFGSFEVTPEREALVERALAATGGTDAYVDLYLEMAVASAEATSVLPGSKSPPVDSIRAQMRPQLEAMMGNAVKGGYLYTFRAVPEAEFERYVGMLEEPGGRYHARLSNRAMNTALVGAVRDIAGGVAQRLLELDAAGEIDLEALGQE